MYFLDVMTFDPKLTKYIPCSVDHKKLEWAFHGLGQQNPYYIFTSTNCWYRTCTLVHIHIEMII